VRALAYDVVLNGRLGSGSIRIHQQEIQSLIFSAMGMSKEESSSRFGFFLEALEYATPPHAGLLLGLDRCHDSGGGGPPPAGERSFLLRDCARWNFDVRCADAWERSIN